MISSTPRMMPLRPSISDGRIYWNKRFWMRMERKGENHGPGLDRIRAAVKGLSGTEMIRRAALPEPERAGASPENQRVGKNANVKNMGPTTTADDDDVPHGDDGETQGWLTWRITASPRSRLRGWRGISPSSGALRQNHGHVDDWRPDRAGDRSRRLHLERDRVRP